MTKLNVPQQPDCLLELPAPTEWWLQCFLAVSCLVPQERRFPDPPSKGNRATAQECTWRNRAWMTREQDCGYRVRAEAEIWALHGVMLMRDRISLWCLTKIW